MCCHGGDEVSSKLNTGLQPMKTDVNLTTCVPSALKLLSLNTEENFPAFLFVSVFLCFHPFLKTNSHIKNENYTPLHNSNLCVT